MDTISFCSDPNPLSLNSGSSATKSVHSDEELILASTRPKKRAGRKKFKETRHPVYRGVRKRNTDKWVCELREPCKQTRIWLGTYPTAEMAARAHDVAALALRGQLACINFADSVWRLPVPATNDAKEIRRVAAMAAEAFRPREERERASDEASSSGCSEISIKNVKGYLKERASSSDSSEISIQNAKGNLKEKGVFEYMDEEAMFDMPGLLANMAQGLLISPPPCISADEISWDDMESEADMSLWSFSF